MLIITAEDKGNLNIFWRTWLFPWSNFSKLPVAIRSWKSMLSLPVSFKLSIIFDNQVSHKHVISTKTQHLMNTSYQCLSKMITNLPILQGSDKPPTLITKLFACCVFFSLLSSADFFSKFTFLKSYFRNTIRVSNKLDPDQAWHLVGPDLGTNCLQRLSADDNR